MSDKPDQPEPPREEEPRRGPSPRPDHARDRYRGPSTDRRGGPPRGGRDRFERPGMGAPGRRDRLDRPSRPGGFSRSRDDQERPRREGDWEERPPRRGPDFRENRPRRQDDRARRRAPAGPAPGLPQPNTARELAASVLLGVFAGPVDDAAQAVHDGAERAGLEDVDRRLAYQLTYLVLRHSTFLDDLYYRFFRETPDRLRMESRIILRLAAAQKALLDRIPDHALGDESVRLARGFFRLHEGEISFINAIIRRIAAYEDYQTDLADLDRPVDRYEDKGVAPLAEVARRSSCPPWIVDLLARNLGTAAWDALPEVINGEAPVVLRTNRLRTTVEELAAELQKEGIRTRPGLLSPQALILDHAADVSRLITLPAYRGGRFYIQDESSQVVGLLAHPQPGQRILDLCAAPGGKSTHLAELAEGQASIVATDVHPRRFGIMLENLRRLDTPGLTARPWDLVVERRLDDAAREDSPEDGRPRLGSDHPAPGLAGSFDLVLLDAPCSGLGTLRRHPEIRHRLRPDDLKRLSRNQLRLLRLASEFVRPGGRLIYSTCTITAQENLRVVEGFLRAAPAWSVEGEPDHLSGDLRRLRSSDGFFRTWPAHKELDGFELVVLVRSERPVPGGGLRNLHRG